MEAGDWASLSDQELLERRISKLGLLLEDAGIEPLVRQLYEETGFSTPQRKPRIQSKKRVGCIPQLEQPSHDLYAPRTPL